MWVLIKVFSLSQYFDLAADVLAENAHLTYKFLSPVPVAIIIFFLLLIVTLLLAITRLFSLSAVHVRVSGCLVDLPDGTGGGTVVLLSQVCLFVCTHLKRLSFVSVITRMIINVMTIIFLAAVVLIVRLKVQN